MKYLFKLIILLPLLLFGSPATADITDGVEPFFTGAFRLSYERDLGFGMGAHASSWFDPFALTRGGLREPGMPVLSVTTGATWHQRGKRVYAGFQTGLLIGAGAGWFWEQGPSASKGWYYDAWGVIPEGLIRPMKLLPGFSLRQYRAASKKPFNGSLFFTTPF